MATREQTPHGRGFDTSLGYFHSTNNYYDSRRAEGCNNEPAVDLWDTDHAAVNLNGTDYEEAIFGRRAVSVIRDHDPSIPLFIYYAFHTSCVGWNATGSADGPDTLQPQQEYFERFDFIKDSLDRRANHAMVAFMDGVVGNITEVSIEENKSEAKWVTTRPCGRSEIKIVHGYSLLSALRSAICFTLSLCYLL